MTEEAINRDEQKECPYCAELIGIRAKKCRFCGETIDVALKLAEELKQNQENTVKNVAATGNSGASLALLQTLCAKSRTTYILLGVFLGVFGVHNFYAGYSGRGTAELLVTLMLGWLILPLIVIFIINLVEIATITTDSCGNPMK